jgi:hypothetical protein
MIASEVSSPAAHSYRFMQSEKPLGPLPCRDLVTQQICQVCIDLSEREITEEFLFEAGLLLAKFNGRMSIRIAIKLLYNK